MADRFVDGVYFVVLQPEDDVEILMSAIADAFDLTPLGPEDIQTQIIDYLSARKTLLVLDNLEHLVDGAAVMMRLLAGTLAIYPLHPRWNWHKLVSDTLLSCCIFLTLAVNYF